MGVEAQEQTFDYDDENSQVRVYAGSSKDILSACMEDIKALWVDPTVQAMLTRRKVRLEEGPGL